MSNGYVYIREHAFMTRNFFLCYLVIGVLEVLNCIKCIWEWISLKIMLEYANAWVWWYVNLKLIIHVCHDNELMVYINMSC